jgi:hypothetical protein
VPTGLLLTRSAINHNVIVMPGEFEYLPITAAARSASRRRHRQHAIGGQTV